MIPYESHTQFYPDTGVKVILSDQSGQDAEIGITGKEAARYRVHAPLADNFPDPDLASVSLRMLAESISSGIHPLLFMENINNGNRQLGNRSFLQWVGQQYAAGRRNDLRAGAARRLQDAGQPLAAYAPLQFRPKKKKKTGGPAEEAAETLSKTTPEAGAATEPEARVTSAPAQPGATATPEVKKKKKKPHTPQAAAPGQVWVSEKAEAAPVRVSLNKREKELFECCFKGAAGRLKHLLRFANIDINMAIPDGTLLCIAAYHGYIAVIRELLSIRGIDVNLAKRGGTTPLYFAAQEGHVEIVRLLSETHGVNVNLLTSEGAAPLYIAAQKGHEPVIRVLLANPKTNVNVRKPSGSTPLFIAAQNNFPGIVELLIKRGANVNLGLSEEGSVPLIIAAIANHVAVVRLLIQAPGIKVNMVTKDGVTALCAAAQKGNEEIVRLLLSKGADPNILSYKGAGPLILACLYRHTAILKMLSNAGADVEPQVRESGGEKFTVYGIARLMDYREAVALLEAYSLNKPAQAARLEKLAPKDEPQWSTPPTTPPPVWSTPPTTPPPDWSIPPVTITPDWSTTPTTTQAFPPPYAMPVTQPGETVSVAAVVPDKAGTRTMEPSETAPVTTVPESPAPAASGSGPTRADIQSPLGTAKNALVQEVLKKLDNNTLEPLEGIRLMIEARAAADMDMLSVFYNRLASVERQRERSRRRPARREVTSALPQAMQQGADFPDYALEDRVYHDVDSIEYAIKKHLEQSCHRFVSQALNDMEFGRGKPTTGYPDLLHASAGIPGVGSCSVFYYINEETLEIRIVGIGHHLDQETYRLNYASRPLGKRGHILRLS